MIEPLEKQKVPKNIKSLGESIKFEDKIASISLKSPDQKTKKKKMENDDQKLFKKLGKIPPYSLHGVNFIMNTRLKKGYDEFEFRGVIV